MLDVYGIGLCVDSYGKIIDSLNWVIIMLGSVEGVVGLGSVVYLDLCVGSDVVVGDGFGQNDGMVWGLLKIDVSWVGSNDVVIVVVNGLCIDGVVDIQFNGVCCYDDVFLVSIVDVCGNCV